MLSIPLSTIYLMTELMITSCGFQNSKGALYAVALKIVGVGRMDDEWAKAWKPAAKSLREDYAKLHPAPSSDISQE
jgi:hypothetical protein